MHRRQLILCVSAAAIARALAARAQQKPMPVIGFLGGASARSSEAAVVAFRQGLREAGYIEARNVAIEYRWAEGRFNRLSELAADLVDRKVNVILAAGDPPAIAARSATSTIPMIFSFAGDPVERGLVASFARPGGNLTGVAIMFAELMPKRFELLSELVPHPNVIGLLVNPNSPGTEPMIPEMQEAAGAKGVVLHILKAGNEGEIDAAFASAVQLHLDAVVVSNDTFFFDRREQLVALAANRSVPASYFSREFAEAGGLVSYGPNINAVYRLLGVYAGKILDGAKAADLPVQQPTRFELVVNLKTAKELGLTVPPSILARADEVIE
jgi:putative tryptophan/tyrosine transport system substrate-binding protein